MITADAYLVGKWIDAGSSNYPSAFDFSSSSIQRY